MDDEASAPVPYPPDHLDAPNVVALASGELVHRVHNPKRAGNAFNPCQGGATRFAPIRDKAGHCIPSLYAGNTVESAIYETVFHDIPPTVGRKTVPRGMVEDHEHSTLLLRRTLCLAGMRAPDLMKWGIRRETLMGSLPTQYERTALWAKAVHDRFDHVDGLIWTSNLCDPDDALLLFGDRVAVADLQVAGVREGADGSFLEDVRRAGERGWCADVLVRIHWRRMARLQPELSTLRVNTPGRQGPAASASGTRDRRRTTADGWRR